MVLNMLDRLLKHDHEEDQEEQSDEEGSDFDVDNDMDHLAFDNETREDELIELEGQLDRSIEVDEFE